MTAIVTVERVRRAELPTDPWRYVRFGALASYGVAYAVWFRSYGIIIDRISVVLSLTLLLVLAHLGRPWYRWRRLALDLTLYSLMWLAYEETRGAADRLGMPIQVESVRNIDRALFLGADPPVWLQQRFYTPGVVRWYDVVASVVYYTHFVVPVVVVAVIWIADRRGWILLMRRFATILAVACVSFVVLPTAPPWMAAGGDRRLRFEALEPLARPAGRGWQHLGLDAFVHAWETGRDWVNRVAAMPSLHAAFSLMVVLVFWPQLRRRWVRALALVYPVTMGLALVYLAEHYVIDVIAGWALVVAAFWGWDRVEARRRARRIDRVLGVLDPDRPDRQPGWRRDGAGWAPLTGRRPIFVTGAAVAAATDPEHPQHREAATALVEMLELAAAGRAWLITDAVTATEGADAEGPAAEVWSVVERGPVPRRRRSAPADQRRRQVMVDEAIDAMIDGPDDERLDGRLDVRLDVPDADDAAPATLD